VKSLNSNNQNPTPGRTIIDLLVNNTELFIFSYSIKKKSLLFWSENAEKILGVKDVAIARDANLFLRHVHPDDRFALLTELESAFSGNGAYRATYRWIRPDSDEIRWLHCRAQTSEHDGEKTLDGSIIDLSREFTGEMSKMAGPDSVQSLLAALPTLVCTIDRDLRVIRLNRADGGQIFNFGDDQFKFEDVRIGRPLFGLLSNQALKKEYEDICRGILNKKIPLYSRRIALEENVFTLEIAPLIDKQEIQGLLLTVTDISKMVHLEREMANLQRAEGLRLLAAGVAHNFNNTLQGILGHAAILQNHADNKLLVEKAGAAITDLVQRASELNKQLLNYQSESQSDLESLDINTVVMEAINSVSDLFTSGLKVTVSFGNPEKIKTKRAPLADSILAIIKNAKEALAKTPNQSRSMAIKTGQVYLAPNELPELASGDYVQLSISDSGTGMEDETLKRCFEPFFTTKERDSATGVGIKPSGLGLPKALANIKELGGSVSIQSAKEIGTSVAIFLPLSEATQTQESKITPIHRINPQVLIVDDDRMVLETIETLITDLGFKCLALDNGAAAYNALKKNHRSIKIALVDAMMPTSDGASVIKGLKRIKPSLKVYGFSGATPAQTLPMINAGAIKILQKPVGQNELKDILLGSSDKTAPRLAV
jgi:nitrogen-specific signal transduction histidine kinase/ActR/RegA family two-component response regulator